MTGRVTIFGGVCLRIFSRPTEPEKYNFKLFLFYFYRSQKYHTPPLAKLFHLLNLPVAAVAAHHTNSNRKHYQHN